MNLTRAGRRAIRGKPLARREALSGLPIRLRRAPPNRKKPWEKLYEAVDEYVRSLGGKVVVMGGVEVQEWPGELPLNFRVAVRCTGRKPKYSESEAERLTNAASAKRRTKKAVRSSRGRPKKERP